jgi:hypothetical protein
MPKDGPECRSESSDEAHTGWAWGYVSGRGQPQKDIEGAIVLSAAVANTLAIVLLLIMYTFHI